MLTATRQRPGPGVDPPSLLPGRPPDRREPVDHPDEQLNDLIDVLLHDTNGSLFVAAEFTELLADGKDIHPEQRRLLNVIHDRIFVVHDVLESLQHAVRLRAGELNIVPRPCSVDEVLDRALPRLLRRARSKSCELRTRIDGELSAMRCDPHFASLVLVNLFFHVSRYANPSHSLALHVEPDASRACNEFSFRITGGRFPAVEPERLAGDRVFLDLAAATASEMKCGVLCADPDSGRVAGLAVPTVDRPHDSPADRSRT